MWAIMGILDYYPSKARKRRWGTWCKKCRVELKSGDQLMRERLDYNSYGCMQYNEYCMKCYNKILPEEIKKEAIQLEKEIKEKQKLLRGLKKGVIIA
jgi:hypothetical protein